jgi:pentatricopeptide repeat protein
MDALDGQADRKRVLSDHVAHEASEISAVGSESSCDPAAPKPKRPKSKHQDPSIRAIRAIRSAIQQCCARNDLLPAIEAYEKAIADGTRIEPQSFYNLLSLCDGLADRGIHIGTPKPSAESEHTETSPIQKVDEESRLQYAKRIKDHMEQLKLPLTETAYSALVKLYSRNHHFEQAELLLIEAESVNQCRPKLRLFSALLVAYCDLGRMEDALRVWLRLSKIDLVVSEKEYLAMIQCATKYGYVRVMERVLLDLSEDVLVPSKETTRALKDWFQSPFATKGTATKDSDAIDSVLHQIKVPFSDISVVKSEFQVQSPSGWLISSLCPIETKTGELREGCLKNIVLKPVSISEKGWHEMMEMNETIGKRLRHSSGKLLFKLLLTQLCIQWSSVCGEGGWRYVWSARRSQRPETTNHKHRTTSKVLE